MRFLLGHTDVLEEIYRLTFEVVRRSAGRVVRDSLDCDSLVHELYEDLVSNRRLRESYRGGDQNSINSWLSAIVRNRAIDFVRRQRRLTNLDAVDEHDVPANPLDDYKHDLETSSPQRSSRNCSAC